MYDIVRFMNSLDSIHQQSSNETSYFVVTINEQKPGGTYCTKQNLKRKQSLLISASCSVKSEIIKIIFENLWEFCSRFLAVEDLGNLSFAIFSADISSQIHTKLSIIQTADRRMILETVTFHNFLDSPKVTLCAAILRSKVHRKSL